MAPLPNVKLKTISITVYGFRIRSSWGLYTKPILNRLEVRTKMSGLMSDVCLNFIPFFGENGENTWIILVPKP